MMTAPELARDRLRQRGGLVVGEVVAALEGRQAGGVEDVVDPRAADAGDHALVAQHGVQRPRLRQALAQVGRRLGPGFRAQRGDLLLLLDRLRRQELHPRGLTGAELAQAQLPVGVGGIG
jgi:hypothetical protein